MDAARVGQGLQLQQLERDRRGPLLPGRPYAAKRAPADLEHQVVAMRPHGGGSPRLVTNRCRFERPGPRRRLSQFSPAVIAQADRFGLAQRLELSGKAGSGPFDPLESAGDDPSAGLGQHPVECPGELGSFTPERPVPLGQRRPIAGEGAVVAPVGEGEQPIEESASFRRGTGGEPHIHRQEHDGQPVPDCVCQPGDFLFPNRYPLLATGVGRHHAHPAVRRANPGLDLKARPAKSGNLLIRRTPERAEQYRVIQRFEQIGLALAVGAQDRRPLRREFALEVGQIAKSSRHQAFEPHVTPRLIAPKSSR